MANLLSDEPKTNSIMPKVKMFEAGQRRLFSQFEVREFCDNLVEGVVKALKDVSKIQKKSTSTRAPVAESSLFISETSKEPDFMFDKEQTFAKLTFLQPEHLSSPVIFSQDFEERPLDYPHQGPLLGTRRPMDVDLYPIFYEEDDHLDEIGPTFDEKALSITPIIMENRLCFDPSTTPTPLTTYIQEHCEKLDLINFLSEMCVKISSQDVKRFGFDKQCFDHFEESLELDLQQPDFCARNSFDSFVFKENSFNLGSYRYLMITGNLLHQLVPWKNSWLRLCWNRNQLELKHFCCDSVLKSDLELLYSNSDHVRNVLKMSYDISCLESILIYNTFFDKNADPWISINRFEIDLLCSKSKKHAHVLNLFFRNCAITCPDTIRVYNTYFDRLNLKRVLHILGKETLVSDLNKCLSCTYDPGILMFVLSVEDKHDQSPKGVQNRSRDRSYQFKIWRCMYPRKPTSKLQGSKMDWRTNPFQEGGNDAPLCSAPGETDMHGLIMRSSKDICSLFDSYLPNHEASTHEITWKFSREFRPPEKLEMANLLSDEPTTNSIMPKNIFHFLVRLSRVNKSLFRWTCASYQATFRNLSCGGLVSHIKHRRKSGRITRSDVGETDHPPGSEYGYSPNSMTKSSKKGQTVGEKYSVIEFFQTPCRTSASGSPLEGTPLEGTPVPCYGVFRVRSQDRPPSSGKWKNSDKQNLPYFRIWKSLTYSNCNTPLLGSKTVTTKLTFKSTSAQAGRYVATELSQKLGRYIATEHISGTSGKLGFSYFPNSQIKQSLGKKSTFDTARRRKKPPKELFPDCQNETLVTKNNIRIIISAKHIFFAKTQTAISTTKFVADHIELLDVLNRHGHLTKMTLVHLTQGK
ncbi:hypothetical protein DY000_02022395 [Brassica cretica]|uniref:Uncharacterized protein n=1 Tax=Brassica cretica TaxID=69181 RepID=A0ABQ7EBN3_BRACR|nr:hypothetical protein DY000_02022395 [Brassica cretica]